MLAEAKSEILRREYRADLAEHNICELKRHIDSQAVEIVHIWTGYEQARREQAQLHEELADREWARRDTRIRSIQKLEEMKKGQEFRLKEFSIRRMVENHLKMSNLYAVDHYFTFPVNQRYFLFLVNQEDC